jgi:disulfide bond formation protein DsbB
MMLVAAASVGALLAAFIAEYVFGIAGCTLCVYQRVPYGLTAALSGVALIARLPPPRLPLIFTACAAVFAIGSVIAIYHVGVQQGLWSEPGVCEAALPDPGAVIDLRSARATRPACSEVDWSVMGLSLAALNAMYSAALAAGCVFLAMRVSAGPSRESAQARTR